MALPPPGDAIVFPGAGAPVDVGYAPPAGDAVLFPGAMPGLPAAIPRLYSARWGQASGESPHVAAPWDKTSIEDGPGSAAIWSPARSSQAVTPALWGRASVVDASGQAAVWGPAALRAARVAVPWNPAAVVDAPVIAAVWGPAALATRRVAAPWGAAIVVDAPGQAAVWGPASLCVRRVRAPWGSGLVCDVVVPSPWGPTTLRDRVDTEWPIVWPIEPDPEYEIPDRGTYIVPYSVGVIRLSDGAEIDCSSLTLSTDVDSWAWSLTAQLLSREAFDLVQPQAGEAVTMQVNINGYIWQFLVDDPTRSEAFNADTYTVTARSVTAQLATPYTQPRDFTSTTSANAQQHAIAELPLSGWTLNWTAPDWLVPIGAWSYQGLNPQQAIARLAAAVGATLQSDLSGQGLFVQPRYPVMPWDLPDATPDYSLPLAACLRTQRRPSVPGTRPNAVYVHGSEISGVLGHVFKSDTAGDIDRATVVDALITDSIAARGLGGQLLADGWQPPEVADILVPLTEAAGDYPIISISDILALTDGATEHLGICIGLTIQVTAPGMSRSQGPEVTQQAFWHGRQINPWSRLQALSPAAPLLVGRVVSVGTGEVTVQLTGGGIITARGSAAVNDWVYVRAGVIEGPAPALTPVEIGV